jgi:hypothetical protein
VLIFNPVAIMWHTKPELKPGGLKQIAEVQPQVMNCMVEAPISEEKLKQVARKYGPTGMFQKQVSGGFKLW